MPKILFFTTLTLWSMGKGHGGPAFTQTVKKYIDEGWEVYLITDEPSNKEYPHLDSDHIILLKPSTFKKFESLQKIGLVFRWLNHKSMTRAFVRAGKKLLGSHQKDVILYGYEIFGVKACKILSQKYSLPMVTRFQGTILSQYKNTRSNWIRRYPHYHALAEKSDLVIMTDDGTQGDRVLKELHNSSPTLFLRNGLELMEQNIHQMCADFPRDSFRLALDVQADETMFLTVSRLAGWKKVERAIDGFREFCQAGLPGKLVIVGDGSSRLALEQRAKDYNISDKVIFVGAVAHDKVYDYMMACDVFLSLYDLSNVGNPLLEAMTLGKCIITLDVGDTRKLISNRENGILLTMQTLPELGKTMAELSADAALRESMGNAAAEYAKANFQTWQERMDSEFTAVSALGK